VRPISSVNCSREISSRRMNLSQAATTARRMEEAPSQVMIGTRNTRSGHRQLMREKLQAAREIAGVSKHHSARDGGRS